jgi:hypothetical protein
MSFIFYYSNFCQNCKYLLQQMSRWPDTMKKEIHFINIDRRVRKPNGATYVVLENSQEILLPPSVNQVPALLLLNKGNQVLFGQDILKYFEPRQQKEQQQATRNNGEPMAFSWGGGGGGGGSFGVVSDNFSYLDQNAQDLSTQGSGGLRQMHNYATLDYQDDIQTPPDNYVPDKVQGGMSLDQLSAQRDQEIQMASKNQMGSNPNMPPMRR